MTNECFNALMERIKKKDSSALHEVYVEYHAYIYRIAYNVLCHREDAEDVASDVFVRIWDKASTFTDGTSHKGWLATLTRNMAIDLLRKQGRTYPCEVPEDTPALDSMSDVEKRIDVERFLSRFPSDMREILHLKFYGGFTLKEIADVMELPPGTVNWKYAEAKKMLRGYGYA